MSDRRDLTPESPLHTCRHLGWADLSCYGRPDYKTPNLDRRSGKWKFIRDGKNEFLYNLSVDKHEHAEFKDTEPATLKRLREEFSRWELQMQQYRRS